jgi:hypothetical protein
MNATFKHITVLLLMFLLAGCGANTRYKWDQYDTKLYEHYKDPSQNEQFIESLKEIMDEAEPDGKVPPGIYAEYGYVLYEQGNSLTAILYFQKEADKWPESRIFMNKMIANARKTDKKKVEKAKPAASEKETKSTDNVPSEVNP